MVLWDLTTSEAQIKRKLLAKHSTQHTLSCKHLVAGKAVVLIHNIPNIMNVSHIPKLWASFFTPYSHIPTSKPSSLTCTLYIPSTSLKQITEVPLTKSRGVWSCSNRMSRHRPSASTHAAIAVRDGARNTTVGLHRVQHWVPMVHLPFLHHVGCQETIQQLERFLTVSLSKKWRWTLSVQKCKTI